MSLGTNVISRSARWKTTVLAVVLSCAIAAPALAATTGAPTDAWITTKVKLVLLTTEDISSNAISVDTVRREVTLHGKVRSTEEKTKAGAVSKKVDGVKSVHNLLQVVPAQEAAAVEQSDDVIKTNVAAALKADASLKDSSISVQSVNKGVVLLGGTAKTLTDHLSAVEVADGVTGVRRVASEIESPNTLADADIRRQGQPQAATEPYGVGDAASDAWITSMVKMRLLANSETPAMDINVDTRDGVVTLFGIVPAQAAKAAAEADARKVGGVKTVANELQVVASAKQAAVKAHDDVLQADVKKEFAGNPEWKNIDIEVKNCVARLSGTVPSGTGRLEAMQMARATRGVCSVQDDLRLTN